MLQAKFISWDERGEHACKEDSEEDGEEGCKEAGQEDRSQEVRSSPRERATQSSLTRRLLAWEGRRRAGPTRACATVRGGKRAAERREMLAFGAAK